MNKHKKENKSPVFICVSSGKGGVGKTTIAVNLSMTLASQGLRTLLVDGDLGLANVDVMLGLNVEKTIRDILEQELDPVDAALMVRPDFYVLPATSGVPEMVRMNPDDKASLRELLLKIASAFEYVIIDAAAGIGPTVTWFNSMSDFHLVVVTPDPASVTDAYALMKVLSVKHNVKNFHLIVNMARNVKDGERVSTGIINVTRKFLGLSPELVGFISENQQVSKSIIEQTPFVELYPESKAGANIRDIAHRLIEICKAERHES